MSGATSSGSQGSGASGAPQYAGLLTSVMSTTLDEDYETVARTRASNDAPDQRSGRVGVIVVLAALGLLMGISALKTEQEAPLAARERDGLIDQIHVRQDRLDGLNAEQIALQAQLTALQKELTDGADDDRVLSNELTSLGVASGSLAVSGPGVSVTVDDGPGTATGEGRILDTDLQLLVNALWASGAEAVAINGHRLTSLTAIRFAGEAITVDYRSLVSPYVITATGDRDTLPGRLQESAGGQIWLALRANYGILFDIVARDRVTVPADPHDHLVYAQPVEKTG